MARKQRTEEGKRRQQDRKLPVTEKIKSSERLQEEDAIEKDQTELELEKLVFGDDAGFRKSLKLQEQDTSHEFSSSDEEKAGLEEADASGQDDNLEALADADVRWASLYNRQSLMISNSSSF